MDVGLQSCIHTDAVLFEVELWIFMPDTRPCPAYAHVAAPFCSDQSCLLFCLSNTARFDRCQMPRNGCVTDKVGSCDRVNVGLNFPDRDSAWKPWTRLHTGNQILARKECSPRILRRFGVAWVVDQWAPGALLSPMSEIATALRRLFASLPRSESEFHQPNVGDFLTTQSSEYCPLPAGISRSREERRRRSPSY